MPYKLFVAGTEGLASDVNTYLMNQSVMTFADATARNTALPTPSEGMCCYLTTPDHFQIWNNTEWVTYDTKWNAFTPTLTNVTASSTTAYYWRVGKVIHIFVYVVISAAPTGIITVSLPINSTSVTRQSLEARLTPGGLTYFGKGIFNTTGTCQVYAIDTASTYARTAATSATVPGAWVSGNTFLITGTYEAA